MSKIKIILSDFSCTLLFLKEGIVTNSLNTLNKRLIEEQGSGYPFWDYFELNKELLECYTQFKQTTPTYIFTTDSIQDNPLMQVELKDKIAGIFRAKQMGVTKAEPQAYSLIAKKLNLLPGEILFVDDSTENLEAATQAGLKTVQFTDNQQTIQSIKLFLE